MKKTMTQGLFAALTLITVFSLSRPASAQVDAKKVKHYLFTNDRKTTNTTTVFKVRGTATPPVPIALGTGGNGAYTSYVEPAAKMVIATNFGSEGCVYVANGGSDNITAFTVAGDKFVGIYGGSTNDDDLAGMGSNGTYLYVVSGSNRTIATFQINAGCGLAFLGDVHSDGLGNESVNGMAVHGDMVVVAYGDGSIESFTNTGGVLTSNGDKQYSAGHSVGFVPESVDISQNGHYAIFGDDGGTTAVEVSDISSGKLTPTVLHDTNLGAGLNATNIMLSPNGELLYVVNTKSATVTALKFNQRSGSITFGCISGTLIGAPPVPEGLGMYSTTGTGSVLYIAEYDSANLSISSVGMLTITDTNGQCTLTENATNTNSPFSAPNSYGLQSIAVYPPRPF